MSWITGNDTHWNALLAQQPTLAPGYRAFYRALWQDGGLDRRVLECCRLRIAAIHDCDVEWRLRDPAVPVTDTEEAALRRGERTPFPADQQAALELAERMPFDQHGIEDVEVAAARRHFGEAGTVQLMLALAFFDATCRMKLVSGVTPTPSGSNAPPSRRGRAP